MVYTQPRSEALAVCLVPYFPSSLHALLSLERPTARHWSIGYLSTYTYFSKERVPCSPPPPPTQRRLPPCCYNNTDHDDAGHGELPHSSPIARAGGLACEIPPPCGGRTSKGGPPLATPLAGTMISASNSTSAYTKVSKSQVT